MISFMSMKIFGRKKDIPKKEARHIRLTRVFLWRLFRRHQVRERIEQANQWALRHKRRTAAITVGLLSLSLLTGILTTAFGDKRETEPSFDGIAQVGPMFEGMRRISDNKAFQLSQVEQLSLKGKAIKHELDSLVRLPFKSHDDSVRIVVRYKQLEMIVNHLQ